MNSATVDKHKLSNEDLLSSLVLNAQNESKRIYRAKNEILPYYKFKKWFKPSKKILQSIVNSVIHTNGTDNLDEEISLFKELPARIPVAWLGVDKKNLDLSETVMIDIDSESTHLPVFCKILIIHQGAVHVRSPALLARDVSVQVGTNFDLNTSSSETKSSDEVIKQKRASWQLIDEYYSTPFYQYRGKSSGLRFNQDTQVNENEFLTYATSETSTEDLISHLRLHVHSKLDIMSENSLSRTVHGDYRMIHSFAAQKRSRRVDEECPNLKLLNQPNIKRYENVCSLTGTRRLTLIMPPTSSQIEIDNNIIKELDFLKHPAKYEEFSVIDACVDTSDLNRNISFENFTYVQLLSDFAFIGKGIQKLSIADKKSSSITGNNNNNNSVSTNNNNNCNNNKINHNVKHHHHNHLHQLQKKQSPPSAPLLHKEDKKPINKLNNIATQTDLFKKINETLVTVKKERPQQQALPLPTPAQPISPPAATTISTSTSTTTVDYNYDISDILERYNLKQLVTTNTLLNQDLDKRSTSIMTPRSKLKSAESVKSPEKHVQINTKDLSLDLTQILSSRENQLQSSRTNRSNTSSRNVSNDLDYPGNEFYYYYYSNSNNSKYPLISRAVCHSSRSNNESELLTNSRSKSSKPILMRTSGRLEEKRQEEEESGIKRRGSAESLKNEKSELTKKHVEFKSNQENTFCSNCQRKKRQTRHEKPMKREQEIFLKIDKTNSNIIENNPNIILIPAVITTTHHRDDQPYLHDKNHEIITIPSRYRRSKPIN